MNHFFSYIYLVRLLTPIVNLVAMKRLLLLLTLAPCIAFGQLTYVPDDNFEQALIDLGYDTGTPDDSVPTANISSVTSLNVYSKSISDLTGIEDFAALTQLNCLWNLLTSLDVSNNTALTSLHCYTNQLTSLDVSGCTALTWLDCDGNQLTSLDVSTNTALTYLYCQDNQLTSLDVSNNTALTSFACYSNQLHCLKLKNGNNINMTYFGATNNPNLTCIEVDDAVWATANLINIDPQTTFSEDCNYPAGCWIVGIEEELPTKPKHLLYITDILGRTTLPTPNTLLFYIYDDGSVEKRIQLER